MPSIRRLARSHSLPQAGSDLAGIEASLFERIGMIPLSPANDLLDDRRALRDRAREAGHLFFVGLLDTEAVSTVRCEILGLCESAGWLRPGCVSEDGIAADGAACVENEPRFMAVYNQVMKLESFHALAHEPALLAMFDSLFGEQTLVHARNIARIIFPHNVRFTTPAHQDFIHIQGTEETWTAWIPLGDCPREMGGLAVLPGSHRLGLQPVHRADGAGGLGIDTDPLGIEWATTDYHLGDVIVFHSLTIHKALPNVSPDRIRLSTDFRYQPLSHPVTAGSFLPHHNQVTWVQVYSGWKSRRYQYYWENLPVRYADFTRKYHEAAGR